MRIQKIIERLDDESRRLEMAYSRLETGRIHGTTSRAEEDDFLEELLEIARQRAIRPWKSRSVISVVGEALLIAANCSLEHLAQPPRPLVFGLWVFAGIVAIGAVFSTVKLACLQSHLDNQCEKVRAALGGGATLFDLEEFPELERL